MSKFSLIEWIKSIGNKPKPDAGAQQPREAEAQQPESSKSYQPRIWQYSNQYQAIIRQGHTKPPPGFGSPTFVWHLGIWQSKQSDEGEKYPFSGDISAKYRAHDKHNEEFFREINSFIVALQRRGRVLRADNSNIEEFEFAELSRTYRDDAHRFRDYQPQSLAFTLWWLDSDSAGKPVANQRLTAAELQKSHYSAMRVRVQVQTHLDHVTVSFFIDAAKPYGHPQVYTTAVKTGAAFGIRRKKVAEGLEKIRAVSKSQILQGCVELDRLPEKGISASDAADLKEVADYFYDGIWKEFAESFGIALSGSKRESASATTLLHGERFADFRGLVMSVPGLPTKLSVERQAATKHIRHELEIKEPTDALEQSANAGIGAFDIFDHGSGEPNTILKSFWPFMRRVTPWADYRDFIGCGIIEWRALYLTALGASGSFFGDEEASSRVEEIPHQNLPLEPEGPWRENYPVRYLVLTKGEPHREQIGRFVERINAIGTSRLFALKNLSEVKNASVHIRLLGRELDGVLKEWGDKRKRIEDWYSKESRIINGTSNALEREEDELGQAIDRADDVLAVAQAEIGPSAHVKKGYELPIPSPAQQELSDRRIAKLSDLVKQTERRLVEIGAALDNIGNGGAGRILYVINRSKFHIDEFERMWPSLEVKNVDGWINYGQFVQRGLVPTFNMIRSTGDRLNALRMRLQGITEMIQTSALIIETEATRSNTETLRRITNNLYYISFPLWFVASALLLKLIPEEWFYIQSALAGGVALFLIWTYWRKRRKGEL
jgi:hypothetical protein